MNYHINIDGTIRKTGWTGHNQFDDRVGWKRVHGLLKQYKKLGFENPVCENTYAPFSDEIDRLERDRRTLAVEQIQNALMGRKGLHAGDIKKHGIGWTEIFAVSKNQLRGYLGKAVQICKKLAWDIEKIKDWLLNFSRQHFGTDSWSEYLYGKKVERTNLDTIQ